MKKRAVAWGKLKPDHEFEDPILHLRSRPQSVLSSTYIIYIFFFRIKKGFRYIMFLPRSLGLTEEDSRGTRSRRS